MKLDPTELERKLEADKAGWAKLKAKMMDEPLVDDDGYPTDAALELIKRWHWTELPGLMDFIKELWAMRGWGWSEVDASELDPEDNDYNKDGGKLYFISTAGWSGNESIISALEQNWMAWSLSWIESRRGGHYIFKAHEFGEDE